MKSRYIVDIVDILCSDDFEQKYLKNKDNPESKASLDEYYSPSLYTSFLSMRASNVL